MEFLGVLLLALHFWRISGVQSGEKYMTKGSATGLSVFE